MSDKKNLVSQETLSGQPSALNLYNLFNLLVDISQFLEEAVPGIYTGNLTMALSTSAHEKKSCYV